MQSNDQQNENNGVDPAEQQQSFIKIMGRRLSRRGLLKGAAAASAAAVAASVVGKVDTVMASGTPVTGAVEAAPIRPVLQTKPEVGFLPVSDDAPKVPAGYKVETLIRWGDPILKGAPAFDPENQTAQAQAQQFGYNCDFIGFMPMPEYSANASDHALLVVNHEYTNPELMFAGYSLDEPDPTKEQVDVELAAHGLSVVEIKRDAQGQWAVIADGAMNRRITAMTPMEITGPAAGHALLKTSDDPTGTKVMGMLNNCSGGKTPWGTVLTAEENFHQYFANLAPVKESEDPNAEPESASVLDEEITAFHKRYGLPAEASERRWESFYDRFDLQKEPNESFRFGWMVEVDPYDPQSTPMKRTALGRFKHEAATVAPAEAGKPLVLYTGDDERFERVYKFVTKGVYTPDDREANMKLLDEGTLYVARFNDDGTGEWLPLVFGEGPLTAANGFKDQGDVLIHTRMAADALEATTMDRPEDIEVNPVNKKVYMVMTKNDRRLEEGSAAEKEKPANQEVNAANPRPVNQDGHIIEVTEEGDDYAATKFSWEIFLLCGHPSDATTKFGDGSFELNAVSPISSPDNIAFDLDGNLWIATDGQPSALGVDDGFFMVPVEGPDRGKVQQFFSAVPGAEVCGPEFSPDNTSLFLAIQHPGEGGTYERPTSYWPDYKAPTRPSVVVVQAEDALARVGAAA